MAIINCPECNKQVSDKAEVCPNCAFPINKKMSDNKTPIVKEGCFLQGLNAGCMTIFIIILFFIIISLIF